MKNDTGKSNEMTLSSFQPATKNEQKQSEPQIPEPDYSSDEDDSKNRQADNESTLKAKKSPSEKIKLTTKATVVLKSTSPLPPDAVRSADDSQLPPKNSTTFANKNIFDELKEQSARITSAARLRFAAENSSNYTDNVDVGGQAPNNVKKNVAEFEKKLNGVKEPVDSAQIRMSKSCMEEFVQQKKSGMDQLKIFIKLFLNFVVFFDSDILAKQATLRQKPTSAEPNDYRRNSAIISAMAEKVAAVNQLVAEQQQNQQQQHYHHHHSGSKSSNCSPVPTSLTKMTSGGSTVIVQKPIAILPGSGSSATLTRRCVTVCEDPIKTLNMQKQQQQIRYQLSAALSGGTLNKTKQHSSSLAEAAPIIVKQSTKAGTLRNQTYQSNSATGSLGKTNGLFGRNLLILIHFI